MPESSTRKVTSLSELLTPVYSPAVGGAACATVGTIAPAAMTADAPTTPKNVRVLCVDSPLTLDFSYFFSASGTVELLLVAVVSSARSLSRPHATHCDAPGVGGAVAGDACPPACLCARERGPREGRADPCGLCAGMQSTLE